MAPRPGMHFGVTYLVILSYWIPPYGGSLTSAEDLLIATSLSLEIGLENKKQHLSSSTIAVGSRWLDTTSTGIISTLSLPSWLFKVARIWNVRHQNTGKKF